MPANRLPPAHAPAWGRRRREGEDGPNVQRGPDRAAQQVDPGRGPRAHDPQQIARDPNEVLARATGPLTTEPDREAERARERRLSEEEYRQFQEERT